MLGHKQVNRNLRDFAPPCALVQSFQKSCKILILIAVINVTEVPIPQKVVSEKELLYGYFWIHVYYEYTVAYYQFTYALIGRLFMQLLCF